MFIIFSFEEVGCQTDEDLRAKSLSLALLPVGSPCSEEIWLVQFKCPIAFPPLYGLVPRWTCEISIFVKHFIELFKPWFYWSALLTYITLYNFFNAAEFSYTGPTLSVSGVYPLIPVWYDLTVEQFCPNPLPLFQETRRFSVHTFQLIRRFWVWTSPGGSRLFAQAFWQQTDVCLLQRRSSAARAVGRTAGRMC